MSRRAFDFYPTPDWATRALLDRLPIAPGASIFEPCAGDGDIVRPIEQSGHAVITSDIRPGHQLQGDATAKELWGGVSVDWTITNPPFNKATEILEMALRHSKVGAAFLLRLSFLEPCKNRVELLTSRPPSAIYILPRISFTGDGKKDNVTCAWLVWHFGANEQKIEIVPPASNQIPLF